MTVLNLADAVMLGASPVDKICLGSEEVWSAVPQIVGPSVRTTKTYVGNGQSWTPDISDVADGELMVAFWWGTFGASGGSTTGWTNFFSRSDVDSISYGYSRVKEAGDSNPSFRASTAHIMRGIMLVIEGSHAGTCDDIASGGARNTTGTIAYPHTIDAAEGDLLLTWLGTRSTTQYWTSDRGVNVAECAEAAPGTAASRARVYAEEVSAALVGASQTITQTATTYSHQRAICKVPYGVWTPPPTPNDNFADARLVTIATDGGTYTISGVDNATYSLEAGEPQPTAYSSNRTAWWKYTPATSGTVNVDTNPTQGYSGPHGGIYFDTELAVYTGSAVNALTKIASDSDSGDETRSALSFAATGGVTYYIQVGTYGGSVTKYGLNVTGPAT